MDSRRSTTLFKYLTHVIWMCALPIMALVIYLAVTHFMDLEKRLKQDAQETSQNVASVLDRMVETNIGALQLLAASPLADDGDGLSEFYNEARLFYQTFHSHVIFADVSSKMLFITATAFGEPLPKLTRPEKNSSVAGALATGKPSVGDVFTGQVIKEPLVSITVPVIREGSVKFLLTNIIPTKEVQRAIDQMPLARETGIEILDGSSKTIARREGSKADKGSRSGESYERFEVHLVTAPWSVVLEAPKYAHRATLASTVIFLFVTILVATLAITVGGRMASRKIANSVSALADDSQSQNSGTIFKEIEAVKSKLAEMAQARDGALEELKKSEQRLQVAQEAAKAGAWEWDMRSNEIQWAEPLWSILGLSPNSCPSDYQNWRLSVHPEDREKVDQAVQKAVVARIELDTEWRVNDPDGSERWVMSRGRPVFDNQGEIIAYVGIVIDITERKQTEKALQQHLENLEKVVEERTAQVVETQKLLKTIIDNLPVAITYTDSHQKYVFSNKTHQSWWARSFEEIRGIDTRELMGEEYAYARPNFDKSLSGQEVTREMSFTFGDGVTRDIWVRHVPDVGVGGNIKGVVALMIDISELKRTERELRQSEKKFRDLAELLPQPVWEMDLNRRFTFGNSALLQFLGMTHEEFLNLGDALQTIIPEYRQEAIDIMEKLLESRKTVTQQSTMLRPDGSSVPCLSHASPIIIDDRVVGIRGITIDVGPLKDAEKERERLKEQLFETQKMASLGTLAGGIAHDFNNMLQIITGYAEILSDQSKPGTRNHDSLENILETATQGAELITKLLAFSQQAQVFPRTIDLNTEIREISKFVQRGLPNIERIELNLMEDSAIIVADRNQLNQAVTNLAINASEAMINGGILKISTRTAWIEENFCKSHVEAKPGKYVLLTISDTGPGMDDETVSRIFDPFFTTKPRGTTRGTGLGLSVVRGIVQQNGGFVICSSKPGEGAQFSLYFPVVRAVQPVEESPATIHETLSTETLLIVEDSPLIAELEKLMFESEGFTVLMASNGRQAIDVYRENSNEIGLVILDLLMPEMSGIDCLMEIRKINPSVKVLVVSGFSPEDELSKQVMPFVKGFVSKPCRKNELVKQARRALES